MFLDGTWLFILGLTNFYSRAIEVVMCKLERMLEELAAKMAVGDLKRAITDFREIEARKLLGLPPSKLLRRRYSTLGAELYFYQGKNKEARELLQEYISHKELLLEMNGVDAREKLQLGEFYYSQRYYEQAVHIGYEVLSQCKAKDDFLGMAESYHYLARFCSRLDKFKAVTQYCDLALENLALEASRYDKEPMSVRWRTGLVLLVAGYALWISGFLDRAKTKLTVASYLLRNTGDPINIANIDHGMGCIERSYGHHKESLTFLFISLDMYRSLDHRLHISRVLTDIGRVYMDVTDWENAQVCFNDALEIAEEIGHVRQKCEIYICFGWLWQQNDHPDLEKSEKFTQKSMSLKTNIQRTMIEANLALGNCKLKKELYEEASKYFKEALEEADRLDIAKLQINAHLCLADLYSSPQFRNIHSAVYHFEKAKDLLNPDFSHYLKKKLEDIEKKILYSRNRTFVVLSDELFERGMKEIIRDLQIWMIEKAINTTNGDKNKSAEKLKISRQGLDKMCERLNMCIDNDQTTFNNGKIKEPMLRRNVCP
jgi:tetratricopeptide (TPR) repeat protein